MEPLKNKALFLFIVLIAFVDGLLVADHFYRTQPSLTSASEPVLLEDIFEPKTSEPLAEPEPQKLPFTTQAPLGMWEEPWADYGEEACVWMAMKWANGEEFTSIYNTADELNAIAAWEEQAFGSSKLTDIPQVLQIVVNHFGHSKAYLSGDLTEEGLRAFLSDGAILILPVNGQILQNPNYSDPAPEHHMIVLYAATETGFLANDPGTRRGEGVEYDTQKILDSVQDLEGERIMLVIER
ncbi:hypothetical protein IPG41_07050 [Candidatus Peregrinibacteria bacterium]|nr:MAG: hypothetical protein IPG41_07050 [Candidatus Peregrinibacteria bacterium]